MGHNIFDTRIRLLFLGIKFHFLHWLKQKRKKEDVLSCSENDELYLILSFCRNLCRGRTASHVIFNDHLPPFCCNTIYHTVAFVIKNQLLSLTNSTYAVFNRIMFFTSYIHKYTAINAIFRVPYPKGKGYGTLSLRLCRPSVCLFVRLSLGCRYLLNRDN